MDRISARVADQFGDVSTLDGVRVDLGDAWFLLRPSGTQPSSESRPRRATNPGRRTPSNERGRCSTRAGTDGWLLADQALCLTAGR